MNSSKELVLRVKGADFYGWESATITRAVDQQASSFSVDISNETKIGVAPGDKVQILYGDELLVTGLVDTFSVEYSATSHVLKLAGRSLTKDLVDCSATITAQFKNQTIGQIARQLVAAHELSVIVQDEVEAVTDFQVEIHGETVFEALQRLADIQELTVTDDSYGNLVFARLGNDTTANVLTTGNAILSCAYSVSENNRYRYYFVRGQTKGNDIDFGKQSSQILSETIDPGARENRVLIINADIDMTSEQASKKAHWQQQANAGKAVELRYTVQGWTGSAGELWRENKRVKVEDSILGLELGKELIIASVIYNLNAGGTTCELTLNHPSAFAREPKRETAKRYSVIDKPGIKSELSNKITKDSF